MVNKVKREELVSEFRENAVKLFTQASGKVDLGAAMDSNDIDAVRDVVTNIQNVMIGSIPRGSSVPKVTKYVTASGSSDKISIVNIKFTNRINSDKKFSFSIALTRGNAQGKAFDFMLSVYETLIVDELININLARVNDVLLQAMTEAGLEYAVRVVSPLGNDGKQIAYISDEEVVFVADEARTLNLDNIIVLFENATDLISEEVIQDNYASIVDELRTTQTPTQLVGIHGGMLISHVCDISKRVKPITLLKKVSSKNVMKLSGNKDAIAYFSKGNIFSIVAKRSGNLEVILSPFDVNTLAKVEYDVLGDIGV